MRTAPYRDGLHALCLSLFILFLPHAALSETLTTPSSEFATPAPTKRLFPPFYDVQESVEAAQNSEGFGEVTTHINGVPIHFAYAGDHTKPVVLFMHGSPGSWEAWATYVNDSQLRAAAFMIAVDRPGYGKSRDNNADGNKVKSLQEQVRLIMEAIDRSVPHDAPMHHAPMHVIGHSYGGPMALRMAIDYPERVGSMLLLAPAISPEKVGARWYNSIADVFFIRPLLSNDLRQSNEEMLRITQELLHMEPHLRNITAPTMVMQGTKDWIVKPENADFAREALVNAQVEIIRFENSGHFIPWDKFADVKTAILRAL